MKREKWRYFRVNEENNSVENVENDPVPDDGNQVQGDQSARTFAQLKQTASTLKTLFEQ